MHRASFGGLERRIAAHDIRETRKREWRSSRRKKWGASCCAYRVLSRQLLLDSCLSVATGDYKFGNHVANGMRASDAANVPVSSQTRS